MFYDIRKMKQKERHEARKKKVIEVLKTYGTLNSGKISMLSGINYYYLTPTLEELEKEGKILRQQLGHLATFWYLKEDDNEENGKKV